MHIFKSVQAICICEQWETPHIKPCFLAFQSFIIMLDKEENMNNKQALCRVKQSLNENIVYYLFCFLFVKMCISLDIQSHRWCNRSCDRLGCGKPRVRAPIR